MLFSVPDLSGHSQQKTIFLKVTIETLKLTAMLKRIFFYSALLLTSSIAYSQTDTGYNRGADKPGQVYLLKPGVDIPVTVAGIAWSAFAFPKIYDKPSIPVSTINSLNKNDLNVFDRWAAGKY